MFQRTTYYITILSVCIAVLYAQLDPELCPFGPPSTILDSRWQPVPSRFEIVVDAVSKNEIIEVVQAFSPTRDAISTNSKEGPVKLYWNHIDKEQFQVLTAIVGGQQVQLCSREPITSTTQTSVLAQNVLYIKPSVLLGYNEFNQFNSHWGISFVQTGILRGIPVNIFRSCFFVDDIKATVAATYYVTDPTVFHLTTRSNQSLILRMEVAVKNAAGARENYTYNVFRYVPNPGRFEERQALETPAGVYCPNRAKGLPVPANIPDRVSANSEVYLPFRNASIYSVHRLHDTEFQFSLLNIWFPDPAGSSVWVHFTELHDFATGLSYRYDHNSLQCSVSDIDTGLTDAVPVDDKPNLVQIGNPEHIFQLDDMEYQYTGEKRCRDRVLCHVWIGQKAVNNTVEQREWYWAISVNGEPLTQWIPMKIVTKRYSNGVLIEAFETSLFDYRTRPFTFFEVDALLADCYRALGPSNNFNIAVLSFKINNEKKYPVLKNVNYLRRQIWERLIFTMRIRPIRIANMIIDESGNDILVTFTLLDAPPRTGPVEYPLKERSLDTLIERLESAINSDELTFRAKQDTKQVFLRARPQSLNVDHRSSQQVKRTTGPRITGLWLGLICAGILVGGVVSFFIFAKLAAK